MDLCHGCKQQADKTTLNPGCCNAHDDGVGSNDGIGGGAGEVVGPVLGSYIGKAVGTLLHCGVGPALGSCIGSRVGHVESQTSSWASAMALGPQDR